MRELFGGCGRSALRGLSCVWALGLLGLLGCVIGDSNIVAPGCEQCPSRCITEKGVARCVACLKDSHCQESSSPTKKCTSDYRCICGSARDCSEGLHCVGKGGCVACINDQHCKDKDPKRPLCFDGRCEECKLGATRPCDPGGEQACKKGSQTCRGGSWGKCEGAVICQAGERCDQGACRLACPKAPCQEGQLQCRSKDDERPGKYKSCVKDQQGCLGWSSEQKSCAADSFCRSGACVKGKCPVGETDCSGTCADLKQSNDHCGACANACPSGQICSDGSCEADCKAPTTRCGSVCADLKTDAKHCGKCDALCKAGRRCDAGQCVSICTQGQLFCDGACVDVQSDDKHCGSCAKACPSGQTCAAGTCRVACPTQGEIQCGGLCVDPQSSLAHCGGCNKPCTSGQICDKGRCQKPCPKGQNNCNGACVDLQSDAKHCGACNTLCKSDEACVSGACKNPCSSGQLLCGGQCVDGQSNNAHCGACNNKCAARQLCQKGVCGACPAGAKELCGNGQDDDCDGDIDEADACGSIPVSNGIADYDVRSDGSLFVLHPASTSKGLQATCYNAGGSIKQALFRVDAAVTGQRQEYPSVHTAPGADRFVVAWIARSTTSSTTRNLYMRVYDGNCKALSQKITWPHASTNSSYVYKIAVDGAGQFAALYRDANRYLRLAFYNKNGTFLSQLTVDAQPTKNRCSGGGYGNMLSINKSGQGLVSCQKHSSDAIFYRRFTANRAWVESDLVELTDSIRNSSWYESHTQGINDNGGFVFAWQSYSKSENQATFFGSKGTKNTHLSFSDQVGYGYDGYRHAHQVVQRLQNDFVLRDTLRSVSSSSRELPIWYRYDIQGKLLAAATGPYQVWSLRTNNTTAYVVENNTIKIVDLSPGKGLCKGVACRCKPQSTRPCYNGGTSTPRGLCKRGTETCQADGLGWGQCVGEVLPQPEVCGNQQDDDCDGSTDENCNLKDGIDLPGVTDFDVSTAGDVVAAYDTRTAILGFCFQPNGAPRRSTFVVQAQTHSNATPVVKISKNGKFAVYGWRMLNSNGRLQGHGLRIYDGQCKALSPAVVLKTPQSYFDLAIDDKGQVSVVYYNDKRQLYLQRYDSKGKAQAAAQKIDDGSKCDYAIHVAVSATSGDGVISCQRHSTNPIYFRQFKSNGTLTGTGMVEVQGTKSNSSWYESHILGVNASGAFTIEWQSYSKQRFEANLYSATGSLIKQVVVGANAKSHYDGFRFPHQAVELFGSDFVLRDGGRSGTPVTWYRYNALGVVVSKATSIATSYRRESLRIGNGKTHIIDGRIIRIGTMTFK